MLILALLERFQRLLTQTIKTANRIEIMTVFYNQSVNLLFIFYI